MCLAGQLLRVETRRSCRRHLHRSALRWCYCPLQCAGRHRGSQYMFQYRCRSHPLVTSHLLRLSCHIVCAAKCSIATAIVTATLRSKCAQHDLCLCSHGRSHGQQLGGCRYSRRRLRDATLSVEPCVVWAAFKYSNYARHASCDLGACVPDSCMSLEPVAQALRWLGKESSVRAQRQPQHLVEETNGPASADVELSAAPKHRAWQEFN